MVEDNIPVRPDLIYDVGLHRGEDTEIYLAEGFRVLAVEANPDLTASARARFEEEIETGRLTILNVGLSDRDSVEQFWICDDKSIWSSFNRALASRNGCAHHSVEIPTRRFDGILKEFGIPAYIKMDIEGKELDCLQAMEGMPLPRFISVEDVGVGPNSGTVLILEMLYSLGYPYFNLVAQTNFRPLFRRWQTHYEMNLLDRLIDSLACGRLCMPVIHHLAEPFSFKSELLRRNRGREFPSGCSGPWGEGVPGPWVTFQQARQCYTRIRGNYFSNRKLEMWCDWHATTDSTVASQS